MAKKRIAKPIEGIFWDDPFYNFIFDIYDLELEYDASLRIRDVLIRFFKPMFQLY